MRQKATHCKICNITGIKLHGRICNSCDYKRRNSYYQERAKHRKDTGYYIGRIQSKDYVKAREHYPNKCSDCGYEEEIGILHTHHIDENRRNHAIENLVILCPNCHYLRHFRTKSGPYHTGARK